MRAVITVALCSIACAPTGASLAQSAGRAVPARPAPAIAPKAVTIAIAAGLSGPDAAAAARMRDGAVLAIEQIDHEGGVGGIHLQALVLDEGAAAAAGDGAQAVATARRAVGDASVLALVGPQTSVAARAMAPALNDAGLASLSPSASDPALTAVRHAAEYRANGRVTFFRMAASDAWQGGAMAGEFAALKLHAAFVLDDGSAYGVALADDFVRQAGHRGLRIAGRARLAAVGAAGADAALADRLRAAAPDAVYYGGLMPAGLRLARALAGALPAVTKGAGDGMYGPALLVGGGFPAAEGWYLTVPAAHVAGDAATAPFAREYRARFGVAPDDGALAAHDAVLVVAAGLKLAAASGRPVTREAVRAAIATGKVATPEGDIQFDANGDRRTHAVSLYRAHRQPAQPAADMDAQIAYLGAVPGG